MLERHHIEGRPAEMIAENLQDAYRVLLIQLSKIQTTSRRGFFYLSCFQPNCRGKNSNSLSNIQRFFVPQNDKV
jgi:hypothetical protein